MENQQVKQIIMRELPGIMQQDLEVQGFILQLSRSKRYPRNMAALSATWAHAGACTPSNPSVKP